MKNKTMKKLVVMLTIGAIAFSSAILPTHSAKAAFNFEHTTTKSTSETQTVKDSQGNEYEVTHTIETVNGETSDFYENVPFEVYNETGSDITGFELKDSNSDEWSGNLLVSDGEEFTLEKDAHVWGLTLNYEKDTKLDVKVTLADGTSSEYTKCSLKDLADGTHLDIHVQADNVTMK